MHFSKFWLQKNYVPNIAQDPFGRETAGIEVTIGEGESLEDAKTAAREFITEYIKANKIESPHIIERYIPEEQLPVMQVRDRPLSQMPEDNDIEKSIRSCDEIKVLESYRLLAKCEHRFQVAYDTRMDQLQQIEIQNKVKN